MVWYQMESFPSFVKLWAKINQDLKKDVVYTISINNQWDVSSFKGEKYIYLSTVNAFGLSSSAVVVVMSRLLCC